MMDAAELTQLVRDEGLDAPVLSGVGHLHNDALVRDRVLRKLRQVAKVRRSRAALSD